MSLKCTCKSHFPPETSKPAHALVLQTGTHMRFLEYEVSLCAEMIAFSVNPLGEFQKG